MLPLHHQAECAKKLRQNLLIPGMCQNTDQRPSGLCWWMTTSDDFGFVRNLFNTQSITRLFGLPKPNSRFSQWTICADHSRSELIAATSAWKNRLISISEWAVSDESTIPDVELWRRHCVSNDWPSASFPTCRKPTLDLNPDSSFFWPNATSPHLNTGFHRTDRQCLPEFIFAKSTHPFGKGCKTFNEVW